MRHTAIAAAAAAFAIVLLAAAVNTADAQKLPRISPDAKVTQQLGLTDLTVTYSRPGVKGRSVWAGTLAPYGKEWRTGANNATTFETTDPITFGGKPLPAGKYGLATVPGEKEWIVIVNSVSDAWGTVYDPSKDVLRVTVPAESAPHQEWMSIGFEDLMPNEGNAIADKANLVIRWEKVRVAVPIAVEWKEKGLANSRTAVAEAKPDDWRTAFNAARYAFQNDLAPDEGKAWLQKSIAVQKNYSNLSLLARWQMKDGQKKEALATAKEAIAAGKAAKEPADTTEMEKLVAEWSGEGAEKKKS
jgi:hypothetical protein